MAEKRGRHYLWLCIPIFTLGAWPGMRVSESAYFIPDLHAYVLLCECARTQSGAEKKAKADEALGLANDPDLNAYASMISDAMTLCIKADIQSVTDNSQTLTGILNILISGVLDRKLSLEFTWLVVKQAWYHDLAERLDTHYQRLRLLANITGGLIGGLVPAGLWLLVAPHIFRDSLKPIQVAGQVVGTSQASPEPVQYPVAEIECATEEDSRF
ncbi:MAG: hypothetical protein WCT04_12500 [Planctomycetota bacterium]